MTPTPFDSAQEKLLKKDLESKEKMLKQDLQAKESTHSINVKLLSISKETLLDDVMRLTHERNEALVIARTTLDTATKPSGRGDVLTSMCPTGTSGGCGETRARARGAGGSRSRASRRCAGILSPPHGLTGSFSRNGWLACRQGAPPAAVCCACDEDEEEKLTIQEDGSGIGDCAQSPGPNHQFYLS